MTVSRWIELEGAVNVRDLGSLPTSDGRVTAHRKVIRSDNLQQLSETDVRWLVDDLQVRSVIDLRTNVEISNEGPGPLTREPLVTITELSLFQELGRENVPLNPRQDKPTVSGSIVLPWQNRNKQENSEATARPTASEVYLSYLTQRPESVLEAMRIMAYSDGATVVHCAAGKDRTGIIVALALEEIGVEREETIADYALTAERIEAVMRRLLASATYSGDLGEVKLDPAKVDRHTPRAETMRETLTAIDDLYGGVAAYLRERGWVEADSAALRARLLEA